MPLTFSYITLAQLRQQISNRLYDASQQFWSPAELTAYIQDALRTWNALTGYWRGDFTYQTQQGTVFYDQTDTSVMPNTLRPFTLKDSDLYPLLQFSLLEPAVGVNPWAGVSTQFTADDLINAVQRRRDELLSICGCTISRRIVPAVSGRIQLPDSVIDVRRMAYLPDPAFNQQTNSVVWQEDTWGEQSFNRGYTTQPPGTPFAFLLSTQPPLAFDTDRAPAFAGSYELLTVEAGAALSASTPTLLGIPDDWTHVIRWGALADLLSKEANSKDTPRAQYCEARYRMASTLLTDAPATLAARINNVPLLIDSVRGADLFRTGWQGLAQQKPDTLLTTGMNLVACAPTPDVGPYSVTLTDVRNAPVPIVDLDTVQVARDDLDAVIDLVVHTSMFKCGGAEFASTMPLFERFLKQAALYNSKLNEWGEFSKVLERVSQQEEALNPRMVPQETQ